MQVTFGRLTDVLESARMLDQNDGLKFVFLQSDTRFFIIEQNTYDQLFEGLDSKGTELESIGGGYAASTIAIKQRKGLPFDRVTLFDEGDFYDSFRVQSGDKEFTITANSIKSGFDLQTRWGFELLGLTSERIEEVVEFIAPKVAEWLQMQLTA